MRSEVRERMRSSSVYRGSVVDVLSSRYLESKPATEYVGSVMDRLAVR